MVKIAQVMREKLSAERSAPDRTDFNFVGLYAREKRPPCEEKKAPALRTIDRDPSSDAARIYSRAVSVMEDALSKAQKDLPVDYHGIVSCVDATLQELVCKSELLISMATSTAESETSYLHSHPVNTAILSLVVGIDRKLNMSQLRDLGVAAFLHDIGIAKVSDLVERADRFTAAEVKEVRRHPMMGLETLKKIDDIGDHALRVVYEEHERLDGSGYPHGHVGGERLSAFSPIVSAVDVFEALTHDRAHRPALPASEAFKKMLSGEEARKYDADTVRVLISHVGLHPVGSWVKLSNGEVAKVVGLNCGYPLKPRVNVFFDHNGWKLKHVKSLNMAENAAIQIVKSLGDDDLKAYWERSPS